MVIFRIAKFVEGHFTHKRGVSINLFSVDDEFVPHDGDKVEYKTILIPPKNEKLQAVHIRIIEPVEGVKHERWDAGGQYHGTPH